MSLSPRHTEAIDLILSGSITYTQVAEQMDIRRETLWKWRQLPEFASELQLRRKRITASVDERLAEIEQFALQGLIDAAAAGPNSFSVRACRHLMDIASKRLVRDPVEVTPMTEDERIDYLTSKVRTSELIAALERQGISVAH